MAIIARVVKPAATEDSNGNQENQHKTPVVSEQPENIQKRKEKKADDITKEPDHGNDNNKNEESSSNKELVESAHDI